MPVLRPSVSTLAAAGTLVLGVGGNAAAAPSPAAEFGQHLAEASPLDLKMR